MRAGSWSLTPLKVTEPPIAARGQRDGDRRWLVAPPDIAHATRLRRGARCAASGLSALMTAQRRPSRAAAIAVMIAPPPGDRVKDIGLELLAAARQAIERVEDQIVERLTCGDQIEHERKVS